MDKRPVDPKRRRRLEAGIRVIDLVVYGAVFLSGVYAVAAPPDTIGGALAGAEVLIVLWSALLLGGGLVGFVGRLTRYWLVETPATVASAFGIAIYLTVLGQYAFSSPTVTVATALFVVALGFMVRRWLELQIFSTEPGAHWRARLQEALHRRTRNVVYRSTV